MFEVMFYVLLRSVTLTPSSVVGTFLFSGVTKSLVLIVLPLYSR